MTIKMYHTTLLIYNWYKVKINIPPPPTHEHSKGLFEIFVNRYQVHASLNHDFIPILILQAITSFIISEEFLKTGGSRNKHFHGIF